MGEMEEGAQVTWTAPEGAAQAGPEQGGSVWSWRISRSAGKEG